MKGGVVAPAGWMGIVVGERNAGPRTVRKRFVEVRRHVERPRRFLVLEARTANGLGEEKWRQGRGPAVRTVAQAVRITTASYG